MNPRARRLRRLRRESFRKAWRSKVARRASMGAFIRREMVKAIAPLLASPQATAEHNRQVVAAAVGRFVADLRAAPPHITCEFTSTPEELFRDGRIEATIAMPVPPGFTLVPVEE